jgi:hypothetical protein
VTHTGWYERPEGEALCLRKTPRLASWNKRADSGQIRLQEYLEDTAQLVRPTIPTHGPWILRLDVGLPESRDLMRSADLDNYVYPLAAHLRHPRLVSVWCSKRHAEISYILATPARTVTAPPATRSVRTSASSESPAYKQQVNASLANVTELAPGPVRLQIAFTVGPSRNWLNLWKPTIDALDPLLGRAQPDRDWNPNDGRITELGLHVTIDTALGNDVVITLATEPVTDRIS